MAKLNPTGSTLLYASYLGGNGGDGISGLALGAAGNLVLAGTTNSADFPTVNEYRLTPNGHDDGYVAKLKADGSALLWATYLGGSEIDRLTGLALNAAGNPWLSGYTNSTNFPTARAFQPALRAVGQAGNAFVTRLSTDGKQLDYSTYLGGSSNSSDISWGIAVDAADNAYVTGYATSI